MKKAKFLLIVLSSLITATYIISFSSCNSPLLSKFKYTETTDGICIDAINNKNATQVTIPNEINGKKVTRIGPEAFYQCSNLMSIYIPNTVTHIGNYAFAMCYDITELSLPESITYLGQGMLFACDKIERITIPSGEALPNGHFWELFCSGIRDDYDNPPESLKEVVISGGERISKEAFDDCEHITTITIPTSVKQIGDYAFYFCSSLETINFLGTKKQWNAIEKGVRSFYTYTWRDTRLTVHCTDGTIIIDTSQYYY
jgi:hypothetical protein